MHVSWSPTASCTSFAVTAESTPPDSAQMTLPLPTCARMRSTVSAAKLPGVHVPLSPQMPCEKLRSIKEPCGVWATSGWNWMP